MASSVSSIVVNAMLKNPRIVGPRPNGTRPVDIKIFQQVVRETLANKAVMQNVINAAMKQVEFRLK